MPKKILKINETKIWFHKKIALVYPESSLIMNNEIQDFKKLQY